MATNKWYAKTDQRISMVLLVRGGCLLFVLKISVGRIIGRTLEVNDDREGMLVAPVPWGTGTTRPSDSEERKHASHRGPIR